MLGLQKIDFFQIFRKFNTLRVYCKNFGSKYQIFTKLQRRLESAPRPNDVSRAAAAAHIILPLYCCHVTFILSYRFLNFCLYFYSSIDLFERDLLID